MPTNISHKKHKTMNNQTSNMDVNTNFISFFSNNHIEIPLIQRDYVQGSKLHAEKRDAFIDALYNALMDDGTPCELDFIYGTFENKTFFPLDGQQRLTTLYLLHWYLLNKCRIENPELYVSIISDLHFFDKQFSYKTRRSSSAFCQKLTAFRPESLTDSISKKIKDQNWFSEDWQQDPTILAMLDMLDALDEKYKKLTNPSLPKILDKLLSPKAINFDKLDIGAYKLTDSLYIKMNARGKQLTNFENWKANFIQFLEENYDQQYYTYAEDNRKNNFPKIKDYFTHSIEHQWTDLFWNYAIASYKDKENKLMTTPLIDPYFLNFYLYICRILSSLEKKNEAEDDKSTNITEIAAKLLFKKIENIDFLFRSLDLFVLLSEKNNKNISSFFKSLFYFEEQKTDGRVKLFYSEKSKNEDLFELCIKAEATVDQQILLFCIIKYCIKHRCYTITDELKKYTRVCRNLLESINQRLSSDMKMHSNVRYSDLTKYIKTIEQLSSVPDVALLNSFESGMGNEEDTSAAYTWMTHYPNPHIYYLEDSDYTHGCLYAFDSTLPISDIQQALEAFEATTDLVRVRILVAFGYEGANFGWCAHGTRQFFGYKDRWDVLFRYSKDMTSLKKAFNAYTRCYQVEKDLNKIIDNQLQKQQGSDNFIYYFLKYDAFANSCLRWRMNDKEVEGAKDLDALHFFAIKSDYDIITLPRFNGNPLLGYHTDPYACTVAQDIRKHYPFIYEHMDYTGRNSYKAPISFDNCDIELRCEDAGWLITHTNSTQESEGSKKYIEQSDKDRIEVAVEFIKQLFKS